MDEPSAVFAVVGALYRGAPLANDSSVEASYA
jgi:hypothetical protein